MITVICLLFSLTACGEGSGTNSNTEPSAAQSQVETPSSESVEDSDACKGNVRGVHQIRNVWMVDHSARVIAVFSGEKSGTKNTIDYANRVGVEIEYIKG